jgi:hypothetical protein
MIAQIGGGFTIQKPSGNGIEITAANAQSPAPCQIPKNKSNHPLSMLRHVKAANVGGLYMHVHYCKSPKAGYIKAIVVI